MQTQKGNVLFLILIAMAQFAVLLFAVTGSSRSISLVWQDPPVEAGAKTT